MAREIVEAVVFDLDGVLTDTAALHFQAWKELFDGVLAEEPGSHEPFTMDDYRRDVDGRPRADGVAGFLAARGIHRDQAAIAALAERKDSRYVELLHTVGPKPFAASVALVRRLAELEVPMAVVSASRHTAEVLDAAGLSELLPVRVDGIEAQRLHLPGKPDPATFLAAARRLGRPAAKAAVFEDAVAGVQAGRAGGFGLVVGVDRTGSRRGLVEGGADVVVDDLAEVRASPAGPGRVRLTTSPPAPRRPAGAVPAEGTPDRWQWSYTGWDPADEGKRESLCTLGNGYQSARGAFPGSRADAVHYPGVYVAGCYNRAFTMLDGHLMGNESLVNLPDWLVVRLRPSGGEWLLPEAGGIVDYEVAVDLRAGLLRRRVTFEDGQGRRTTLIERRLVHMGDPHLAAVELTVVAENWQGPLEVQSGLDGRVANTGVRADRGFATVHLGEPVSSVLDEDTVRLVVTTRQSKVRVAEVARTSLRAAGRRAPASATVVTEPGYVGLRWEVDLQTGVPLTVEKVVGLYTSRDPAVSEPAAAAAEAVSQAPEFETLLDGHRSAWERCWSVLALESGDDDVDGVLRLHAFHLTQTLSRHTRDLDVGVPARGLHGEGYRGHVFWDEVLVLPFLTFRRPMLVRQLLGYRYRRLPAARRAAADSGFAGALFPWQSGSDGAEETPEVLFNPLSQRWMGDHSRLQRHVGLAIAYNVWHYYQTTGDIGYLAEDGVELLVEISRFFASASVFNPDRQRHELRGVMGPDEFHDAYPGAAEPGIDNNAYTNVMVVWLLQRTMQALELIDAYHPGVARAALDVRDEELSHWADLSARMFVPFHDGVISQFEGYEALAELDWDAYHARYGNIGRLDLILEAEGDSPNRYKLSKQPDTLMLLYLLSAEELRGLLGGLGYELPATMVEDTVSYYLARTSHGSTLSRVVDAWILSRADRETSWRYFTEATAADVRDTQGGTTAEGIHLGAMTGSLDMVQRCYTGLEVRDDQLWLNPLLPDEVAELRLELLYRSHWLRLRFTDEGVDISSDVSSAPAIKLRIGRRLVAVPAGRAIHEWVPFPNGAADGPGRGAPVGLHTVAPEAAAGGTAGALG